MQIFCTLQLLRKSEEFASGTANLPADNNLPSQQCFTSSDKTLKAIFSDKTQVAVAVSERLSTEIVCSTLKGLQLQDSEFQSLESKGSNLEDSGSSDSQNLHLYLSESPDSESQRLDSQDSDLQDSDIQDSD